MAEVRTREQVVADRLAEWEPELAVQRAQLDQDAQSVRAAVEKQQSAIDSYLAAWGVVTQVGKRHREADFLDEVAGG